MGAAFVITPKQQFDTQMVRRLLTSHPGVIEEKNVPNSYIFAGDQASSIRVANARATHPDEPHWVIYISVAPTAITVYREAMAEVLSSFRPVLIDLLTALPYETITDDEGRPFPKSETDVMADTLLS